MQYYVHSDLASGGGQYSAPAWSEVQQMAMEVADKVRMHLEFH